MRIASFHLLLVPRCAIQLGGLVVLTIVLLLIAKRLLFPGRSSCLFTARSSAIVIAMVCCGCCLCWRMVQVVPVASSCVNLLLWRALYELFKGLLLLLDTLLFDCMVPFLFARTPTVYRPIKQAQSVMRTGKNRPFYLLTFIPR